MPLISSDECVLNFLYIDAPVIAPLTDKIVIENDTVVFTCELKSQPLVTEVTWWLNGTSQLVNGSGNIISELVTTNPDSYTTITRSTLTVTGAKRKFDAGEITCRGKNAIGTTDEKAKLIVHCKLFIIVIIS